MHADPQQKFACNERLWRTPAHTFFSGALQVVLQMSCKDHFRVNSRIVYKIVYCISHKNIFVF